MNWIALIPLLLQAAPSIISLWNTTSSNATFGAKLNELAPEVGTVISSVGSQLFPKAAGTIQKIGGAIAVFNTDYTRWLQGSLNILLPALNIPFPTGKPLLVDGSYGYHTRDAVEAVQAHYGIVIDGVAGNITQGWIAKGLALLPQIH